MDNLMNVCKSIEKPTYPKLDSASILVVGDTKLAFHELDVTLRRKARSNGFGLKITNVKRLPIPNDTVSAAIQSDLIVLLVNPADTSSYQDIKNSLSFIPTDFYYGHIIMAALKPPSILNVFAEYERDNVSHVEVYRKGLMTAVGAICLENGCDSVKKSALETLTEILQSFITEVARNTRQYCEVGGRSVPTFCDVQASLADCGIRMSDIPKYIQLKQRVGIAEPAKSSQSQNPNVLLVGEKRVFPNFIPESSNFPKFPDPHTYIRTRTGKSPEGNYGILRERGSSQRWDVERALTKFIAKTGTNHPLLPDDKSAFPLIAAVPPPITYQSALLPYDNDIGSADTSKSEDTGNEDDGTLNSPRKAGGVAKYDKESTPNSKVENIHNPYLRLPKMPKVKKRRR